MLTEGGTPFDAIHKYGPISRRFTLVKFNTGPSALVTATILLSIIDYPNMYNVCKHINNNYIRFVPIINTETPRWESAGTVVRKLRKFLIWSSLLLRQERFLLIPDQLVQNSNWSRSQKHVRRRFFEISVFHLEKE